MKNFKTIRKNAKKLHEFYGSVGGSARVGPPDFPDNGADNMGSWTNNELSDTGTFRRINFFLASIGDRLYMDPIAPLQRMQEKLNMIGLSVKMPAYDYTPNDGDELILPIRRFGGIVGMHPELGWTNTNGFDGEDWKLRIEFKVEPKGYRIFAQIIPGDIETIEVEPEFTTTTTPLRDKEEEITEETYEILCEADISRIVEDFYSFIINDKQVYKNIYVPFLMNIVNNIDKGVFGNDKIHRRKVISRFQTLVKKAIPKFIASHEYSKSDITELVVLKVASKLYSKFVTEANFGHYDDQITQRKSLRGVLIKESVDEDEIDNIILDEELHKQK